MEASTATESAKDTVAKTVDEWPDGLRIGFKSLTTKTVALARLPSEVLLVCARHNLRENNGGHRHRSRIDPARTPLNSVLEGESCPERVAQDAAHVLARLGLVYPCRVDAVAGFEVVIQPPQGFDTVEFWCTAMDWVHARYEHVVSVVVHRDQRRPHAHILALPVHAGGLAGREMQRGEWGVPRLRADFLAHMRAVLGIRNDRPGDAITRLALSSGRGPKSHAEAARRDARIARRVPEARTAGMDIDGHGHSTLTVSGHAAMSKPTMSSNAQLLGVHPGRIEAEAMVRSHASAKAGAKQGADGLARGAWVGCAWRESFMAAAAVMA